MNKLIVIVDDEPDILELVSLHLKKSGFEVKGFQDADTFYRFIETNCPDLIILDLMLPQIDGWEVCRELRRRSDVPILMLTARGQIEDRVAGLDSGADDYLVKPFAFDELLARVRALSRRRQPNSIDPWELRHGDLVMDTRSRTARRGDINLDLTKTEWDLLEFLMRHPGQALARQQVLDYVWSYERDVQPSVVDVYISYLRRKLDQPGKEDPIETIRGIGYRLKVTDV